MARGGGGKGGESIPRISHSIPAVPCEYHRGPGERGKKGQEGAGRDVGKQGRGERGRGGT